MMIVNGQEVCLIADGSRGEDDPATAVTLNFAEMRQKSIIAFWTRAANGFLLDATYPLFRKNCFAAQMPFGAFGTIYPGDAKSQAQNFIKILLDNRTPELSLAVDWEVEGVTWQMADTYIANLEQAFPGAEIIIYSRSEFLKRMLPNRITQAAKYNRFAKLAIWQAHYGVLAPDPLPAGFTRVLWQFTSHGVRADFSTTGESLNLDLDYFFGTEQDFRTRFGLMPGVPDPTPVPVPATLEERVKVLETDMGTVKKKLGIP